MEVDKAIDKRLADIIFTVVCKRFVYDIDMKRFQLQVSHVSEYMFRDMADKALEIGKKLKPETINSLLQWTLKDAYYSEEINYSLPVTLILNGEAIRLEFKYNENIYYVDLMKMTETEFLILQTDLQNLNEKLFMQIYSDDIIGNGGSLVIPTCNDVILLRTYQLKPLEYHNFADWHFMRDLWRYRISDNLWNAYNSLLDFVNSQMSWNMFLDLIDLFNKNGLSTFVLRMMLNSIKR